MSLALASVAALSLLACVTSMSRAALNDGDRQMVAILTAVLGDGLTAVEAAFLEALRADVVLNILARQREPTAAALTVITPDALRLGHEPEADCARYQPRPALSR